MKRKFRKNIKKVLWTDYGESSLTLLSVLVGMDKQKPTTPYDPSDFKRCVHLFECLELEENEIYDLLNETASKYPEWQPFTDNWSVLMDLYLEEKEKKDANKLYEEMLKLRIKHKRNQLYYIPEVSGKSGEITLPSAIIRKTPKRK